MNRIISAGLIWSLSTVAYATGVQVELQVNAVVVEHSDKRLSIQERLNRFHDRLRAKLRKQHEAHVARLRRGITSRLHIAPDLDVVVNLPEGPQAALRIEVISEARDVQQAWMMGEDGQTTELKLAGPGEIIVEDLQAAEDVEIQLLMADGDAVVIWLDELGG